MKHALLIVTPLMALVGCANHGPINVFITDDWSNPLTADVEADADLVWFSAKTGLSSVADYGQFVDEEEHVARAIVDDAIVVVRVVPLDSGEMRILVEAKKYMVNHAELAELVMNRVMHNLEASRLQKDVPAVWHRTQGR